MMLPPELERRIRASADRHAARIAGEIAQTYATSIASALINPGEHLADFRELVSSEVATEEPSAIVRSIGGTDDVDDNLIWLAWHRVTVAAVLARFTDAPAEGSGINGDERNPRTDGLIPLRLF